MRASYSDQDLKFIDTWRFSAGYTYLGKENAANYLGLIGIRMGCQVQDYYIYLKGQATTSWGASFSVLLPLMDGKSSINLGYSYDQIGTLKNSLNLKRSQKFTIYIVVRDFWGARRKFD